MSYRVKRLNLMSHEDLLVLYFYLWIPILVIFHSNCHLYDLQEHCKGLPQYPATRSHREFIKTIKLNWCVLKLSTQTPKTHQISIILKMDEKIPCYVLILWLLFFSACFILWDKGFFFVNVLLSCQTFDLFAVLKYAWSQPHLAFYPLNLSDTSYLKDNWLLHFQALTLLTLTF